MSHWWLASEHDNFLGGFVLTIARTTIAIALLLSVLTSNIAANNNLFLPGDAYFPAEVTAEEIGAFAANPNEHAFSYSSFGGYGAAFCGYAGYRSAKLPDVDAAFAANLKTAYEKIRANNPRQLIETRVLDDEGNETGELILEESNPVGVMFYNDDFDFEKFKIALRYNENWLEDTVSFGHSAEHARLCPLVSSSNALAMSWRDAAKVKPLKATIPDREKNSKPSPQGVVAISGTPKAIVFNFCSPDTLFSQPKSIEIFVVDANGIRELFPVEKGSSSNRKGGVF